MSVLCGCFGYRLAEDERCERRETETTQSARKSLEKSSSGGQPSALSTIHTVQPENIAMIVSRTTSKRRSPSINTVLTSNLSFPSVSSLPFLLPNIRKLRQASIHALQQRLTQPMRPRPQTTQPACPTANDHLGAFAGQNLLNDSVGNGLRVEYVGLCRLELVGERLEEGGCGVGRVDGGEFYRGSGVAERC